MWLLQVSGGYAQYGAGGLLDLGNMEAREFIRNFLVQEVEAYELTVLRFGMSSMSILTK